MALIVSKEGKDAHLINSSEFEKEDILQQYIYDNPNSLPLYEIKDDIKLFIACREFQTSSGRIDAVGFDINGDIYLIETKLYKNPDKRLVIAQVLDYGASLFFNYSDVDDFIREIDKYVNGHFHKSLNEQIISFFEIKDEDESVQTLIENIRNNFINGRFKFVVLMNKLDSRLKDLIRYLNQNSKFDIYGIEIEYYKFEQYEIVIPKLYGAEVKKELENVKSYPSKRRNWDELSFFEDLNGKVVTGEYEKIKQFYEWAKNKFDEIVWGTGFENGSFSCVKLNICSQSIINLFSDGTLRFPLHFSKIPDKYRDLVIDLLNKLGLNNNDFKNKMQNYEVKVWIDKSDKLMLEYEKILSSFI